VVFTFIVWLTFLMLIVLIAIPDVSTITKRIEIRSCGIYPSWNKL